MERASFTQIIRKLEFLLDDRYLQDSFLTLFPLIKIGILEYLSLSFKEKLALENKSLDLFSVLIECCYTNRYRGNPSFGETAVLPTLGYYSVGSKVLVLLDFVSNRIIKVIYEKYAKSDRKAFIPRCVVTTNVTSTTAVSFTPFPLPLSFILLPPQSISQPLPIIVTFLHELGHVVFDSFLYSTRMYEIIATNSKISNNEQENKENAKKTFHNIRNTFSEVFAEFFAAKVLTDLDFKDFKEITLSMLEQLFENTTGADSAKKDKIIEVSHAESLNNYIKKEVEGDDLFGPRINDLFCGNVSIPIAKEMREFFISIANMDDEVISEFRRFYQDRNSSKAFWDLWIFINQIRSDCYVKI